MDQFPPRVIVDLEAMTVRFPLGSKGAGNYVSCEEMLHVVSEARSEVKALVDVLIIAKAAIESLTLTQKEVGMGLLGKHLVGPETLKRINKVLGDEQRLREAKK